MTSVKRRWPRIVLIAVVLLFLAAAVAALMGPHDPIITLVVSGTPGCKFRGTVEVDGVEREIAGEVPAEFRFRGSRVAYAVKKVENLPNEELRIDRFVNRQPCGGGGNLRGGVAGGLVVVKSGVLLFGNFPLVEIGLGKVDARWWDQGIDWEERDRAIVLNPDAGKIIWGPDRKQ